MSNLENDPLIDRAVDELRRLPAVDPRAVRRVIEAAATARVTPADAPMVAPAARAGRQIRLWASIAVAAAAAITGFMVRGVWTTAGRGATATSPVVSRAALLEPVANVGGVKPLMHQFVFEDTHARQVSVVGDFNQWNPLSAPMTRSVDGTTWSAIVPVLPGRHVYAFMVDGSLLTLDAGKPTARDPDLGTKASVVLVGRP